MKTITFHKRDCLHVETEGCIVNIRPGLTDMRGRPTTSVEIIPDDYAGEKPWRVFGSRNVRIKQLKSRRKPVQCRGTSAEVSRLSLTETKS